MDLVVVLLMLAFIALSWRLICRWCIARGGKRWVGHGLGFIFGPLIAMAVSIPMVPTGENENATISNVALGLMVLAVFLFLEYRAIRAGAKIGDKSESAQHDVSTNSESMAAPNETSGNISFSLKETAEMVLADDVVDQREAELLLKLLDKQEIATFDPACRELHQVLIASLEDGFLDSSEAEDVKALLSEICDRPFERSERPAASKPKVAVPQPKKKPEQIKPKSKSTPKRKPQRIPNAEPAQGLFTDRKPKIDEILAFSYTDSKGDTSEREIQFRSLTRKDGRFYVKGICRTRSAFRTFRGDRIEMLCFADTGELA